MKHKDLAERFLQIAQDFEDFVVKNNLCKTSVDMDEPCDKRKGEVNLCDTPACHGGWAAIMYSDISAKDLERQDEFYTRGADILAQKLGFIDHIDLEDWARLFEDLWGNPDGGLMFCDAMAFGKDVYDDENVDVLYLTDIIKHYREVAYRLMEHPEIEVPDLVPSY